MSIKPQFETHRYVGEVCRLRGQSIVECRLPGSEISSVLAVRATAIPSETACMDGGVQYSGKVLLSVVYEDGDRRVCRAERGAEFFHKAEGKEVSPACFAKVRLSAENVTWRREGSGLYISVIADADIAVYGNKQMEYLAGGDGFIVKKEPISVCKSVCVSGETEGEDEFTSDYVGDILLHSERALVHSVTVGAGHLDVEGELSLNICVLKPDNALASYERLLPFRMQIPCEDAFGHVKADGSAYVKSARLTATTDEDRGKSKIVLSYCISADCKLYIQEEFSAVQDAFSTDAETSLRYAEDGGRYLMKQVKRAERVGGFAALSSLPDGEFTLQAAVMPRAEIVCKKTEKGMEAEGAVLAEIVLVNNEGMHRSATLSLPFLFPVDAEGEAEIDCVVCGLNVRRKKNGETEAEGTLKMCVRSYGRKTWRYVNGVEEGAPYPKEDGAFTVFMPRAGEDEWSLCKRLGCSSERLKANNGELKFPLKGGERICVYRQLSKGK